MSDRVSGVGVDVAAARTICDGATPGPWSQWAPGNHVHCDPRNERGGDWHVAVTKARDLAQQAADAEFIAAAREGWPAALDEIIVLRAEVRRLKAINDTAWVELRIERDALRAALDRVTALCDEADRELAMALPPSMHSIARGDLRTDLIRAAASVSAAPEKPERCGSNCAACWRERHVGHDVGWRHEDGSLYSATCRDCGEHYWRELAARVPVSDPGGNE